MAIPTDHLFSFAFVLDERYYQNQGVIRSSFVEYGAREYGFDSVPRMWSANIDAGASMSALREPS
jgi:hypothetical protein